MIDWIKSLFAPKIFYPFAGFIERMRQKDPVLYDSIKHMAFSDATNAWRQKYPNDLRGDLPYNSYSELIK